MLGEILGSVFGAAAADERAEDNRRFQREERERSDALQKEFAQSGITWRVEDAKRAGIHPVFALSGGGAAYAPSAVTVGNDGADFQKMGQDIGRAIDASSSQDSRIQRELQVDMARSQIARNNAEADMFRSTTIRNYNQVGPGLPLGTDDINVRATGGSTASSTGTAAGAIEVKPSEVTSYAPDAPWLAAGKSVMFKKYKLPGNREWLLPDANSASEALESVSESLPITWMMLRENMLHNPNFFSENKHLLPDFVVKPGEFLGEGYGALERAAKSEYQVWQEWRRKLGKVIDGWDLDMSGRDRGYNWRRRPERR